MYEYALSFNYDSWIDLIDSELKGVCTHWSKLYNHINAVTDLIQKELLSRVSESAKVNFNHEEITECYYNDYGQPTFVDKESILNTPIL